VFHVELRQFPHVARAFNLSREDLEARILRPLAAARPVELNERRWSPEKVKLTVYEGPAIPVEEMGMGRGWGNVTKTGENVTDRLLAESREAIRSSPVLEGLKEAIVARASEQRVGMVELLSLAGALAADIDAGQRASLAARAIWELLSEGRVSLTGPGGTD